MESIQQVPAFDCGKPGPKYLHKYEWNNLSAESMKNVHIYHGKGLHRGCAFDQD